MKLDLTRELQDFLSGIYKVTDPKKYRETLLSLFIQSGIGSIMGAKEGL